MFYVQYFTYSGLTTTLWCGHFFPIAVEETKLFKSPPSAEIWILILFHFEGLCCLPHLGRSTASRFCSQIPGLQLRFLSFTWSPNLLNLSVSQFPYLLNGGLSLVSVTNNLECLALPVHLISIAILLLHVTEFINPAPPWSHLLLMFWKIILPSVTQYLNDFSLRLKGVIG